MTVADRAQTGALIAPPRARRLEWPEVLVAGIGGAGSIASPIGYDEAYWLAIARMILGGRDLYVDALDNKTPFLHFLTWALDALPGPFSLARGIFFGLVVGLITRLLVRHVAGPSGWTRLAAAVGGAMAAGLSQFHITTELLAFGLLLLALESIRTAPAAALALASAAFDPRSLLLVPAVALIRAERNSPEFRKFLSLVGTGTLAGSAIVLLVPDLRFGLLQLSLSIREFEWSSMWEAGFTYGLPLAALVAIGYRPHRSIGHLAWLLGAIAVPVLSLIPFDHYWTYIGLIAVLGLVPPVRGFHPGWALVVIAAFTPLIATGYREHTENRLILEDQSIAASTITEKIGERPFIYAGAAPFVVMKLPEQSLLRSPTVYYLVYQSPRSVEFEAELPDLLAKADAFVLDKRNGILAFDRNAVFEEFPCSISTEHTELRFRRPSCTDS